MRVWDAKITADDDDDEGRCKTQASPLSVSLLEWVSSVLKCQLARIHGELT